MKKSDIKVGGVYSNGKGRVREVTAEGPFYKLHDGQRDRDCVRYITHNDGTKKNRLKGSTGHTTRASFASWAKWQIPHPTGGQE